jgi:glycerate-2-kinase
VIDDAKKIIESAIASVKGDNLINKEVVLEKNSTLKIKGREYDLTLFKNIYIVGAGKAVAHMAKALEKLLGKRITEGVIVVKDGHGLKLKRTKVYEAAHPIIDKRALDATQKIIEVVRKAGEDDLVIMLITGGGSALFELLPDEISLDDLKATSKKLLECGATIHEVNTVRKHISLVKGGRFLKHTWPAKLITLVISDVMGDDLSVIASGPTVEDKTTFAGSFRVFDKYNIEDSIPKNVLSYIKSHKEEKGNSTYIKEVDNIILGSNDIMLKAALKKAKELGFDARIVGSKINEDVMSLAHYFSGVIKSDANRGKLMIFGGEPTVKVIGTGKGGRNQELALRVFIELKGYFEPYLFMSIGSDGTDGPTDAAGAYVDSKLWDTDMHPKDYLLNSNSYEFFDKANRLIKLGPTGTNVMDLMLLFC